MNECIVNDLLDVSLCNVQKFELLCKAFSFCRILRLAALRLLLLLCFFFRFFSFCFLLFSFFLSSFSFLSFFFSFPFSFQTKKSSFSCFQTGRTYIEGDVSVIL